MESKPEEQRREQVATASEELGEPLVRADSEDEVFRLSAAELKQRYPVRYKAYVEALRSQRKGAPTPELEDTRKWMHVLNSLDEYIPAYEKELNEKTGDPRSAVQFDAFGALRKFLEAGNLHGYIKLPTGVGKTVLFKRFLEAADARAIIIVPTNVLVDQTKDMGYGVMNKDSKDADARFTLTTYASFIRNIDSGKLNPDNYSAIILDEAHHAFGPRFQESLKKCEKLIQVGFTATPDYSQEKRLADVLGPEYYRMELDEAILGGLLANAKTFARRTRVDMSKINQEAGEYNAKQLETAVNIPTRNAMALEVYQELFAGEKAVAFCAGVDHAIAVAALFRENGIPAEHVSGKTPVKERDALLARFAAGEIKVLCNDSVLTEGFNDTGVSVCLNLKPTLSPVVAEQRGGRVLRLNEENPDKVGYVVDFLDDDRFSGQSAARRSPIMFREVLGAVALPHGTATAAKEGSPRTKTEERIREFGELHSGDFIGTEEGFAEILKTRAKEVERQEKAPRNWVRAEEIRAGVIEKMLITHEAARSMSDARELIVDRLLEELRIKREGIGLFYRQEGRAGGVSKTPREFISPESATWLTQQAVAEWNNEVREQEDRRQRREAAAREREERRAREHLEKVRQEQAAAEAQLRQQEADAKAKLKQQLDNRILAQLKRPGARVIEDTAWRTKKQLTDELVQMYPEKKIQRGEVLKLIGETEGLRAMRGQVGARITDPKAEKFEVVYSPEFLYDLVDKLFYSKGT